MSDLLKKLLDCNSEQAIEKIIKSNPELNNEKNWKALGGNIDNSSIVQNTAGSLGACIAEMVTNSIDANLERMKNSYEKENGEIPKEHLVSPKKLMEFLYPNIYNEKDLLKKIAKDSMRIITTENQYNSRSLTIMDKGCGQKSTNFKNTFCSIGAGSKNKSNKPYLHGNYGQGSTSSNAISGEKGYRLIVSRESIDDKWGWTLIRRNPQRPSMYEYFTINDLIPEYEAEEIHLAYHCHGQIRENVATIEYGTGVKLFNVAFEKGFVSIKQHLGPVLFRPTLPISSVEFTYSKEKLDHLHYDNRWVEGLGVFFDNLEQEGKCLSINYSFNVKDGGEVYCKLYYIKNSEDRKSVLGWFSNSEQNKKIFHINNGQVQHTETSSVVGQFHYSLRDNVWIEMDLSQLNQEQAKAYLWKADRTAIQTSTSFAKTYLETASNAIKNSEELQEWSNVAYQEQVSNLKNKKNSSLVTSTASLCSILGIIENSKRHNSNKKLIHSNQNAPSTHARGKLTSVGNTPLEYLTEVEGKIIPTEFKNIYATKTNPKETTAKNFKAKFKNDAQKNHLKGPSAKGKVNIVDGNIKKPNGDIENIDLNKINAVVTQDSKGYIVLDINPNSELQSSIKIGDIITLKVQLSTNENGTISILEDTAYFEISEILQEIETNKKKPNIESQLIVSYGSKDGREYDNNKTYNLSHIDNYTNELAVYYEYYGQENKIHVIINIDNTTLLGGINNIKTTKDKQSFFTLWCEYLQIDILAEISIFNKNNDTLLSGILDTLNNSEYATKLPLKVLYQVINCSKNMEDVAITNITHNKKAA